MVTFFFSKYVETREEFFNVLPMTVLCDSLLTVIVSTLTFVLIGV
jgi:hypothetical protein